MKKMTASFQQTCFIIFVASLVGKGDGWKKPSRETIQHDLEIYKKISENIKKEFEVFYGEYPEEPVNDYFLEEIDYVQEKIRKLGKLTTKRKKEVHIPHITHKGDNTVSSNHNINSNHPKFSTPNSIVGSNLTIHSWPKFKDILLDIGRQYDWKNDRWIKVKKKIGNEKPYVDEKKPVEHQKHNFKYRIVKLNRAKSKRNIVIAVTAIR